ncbi:MAG: Fur family transcriptional regulator [Desulfitobacteriaceae bacterium]
MAANATEFSSALQTCGHKLTNQRQTVWEIILKNKEKHLSTEEIFDEVKKKYPNIGLATVYRTVQLFEKIGLVQHISLDDGRLRYQIADPEEKHEHHHLICEICGDVIDVQEDMLELLEEKVFSKKGFTVTNHRVKVFGICKKCLDDLASKKNNDENTREGNKVYSVE